MTPAPIPAHEERRLKALHKLNILDTPPEERFDSIVDFAASELDVPIALVSLVDGDRQWFKSRVGIDATETPRDISFCGHAVMSTQMLVVEDTMQDPRFSDNPLVLGAPFVRFYAGSPLRLSSGAIVGTLCLIANRPRKLADADRMMLTTLRQLVQDELEHTPAAVASRAGVPKQGGWLSRAKNQCTAWLQGPGPSTAHHTAV